MRELIADGSTVALVSATSLYEIAIKAAIGRLGLPAPAELYLPRLLRRRDFSVLPVERDHALRAGSLPLIHRDPWDRLLIAQAQLESVAIVIADPAVAQYEVDVIAA
ncbi:MAG: type II toxin-antitoxin system VapC family toxin [Chloroflexota bacterium]|nr:type II toxin-antitoxin system VapC family toxin [Chloroflexota bacterium]